MTPTMKSMLPTRWGWKTEDDNGFVSLQRAMNHLIEDFTKSWDLPAYRSEGDTLLNWYPHLDMVEHDSELLVTVELPGLDEKDIDISLTGEMLTIKGSKLHEKKEEKGNWFHSERSWGNFQRTLPLPFGVDREHVKAMFKQGVLTITLPKTAEAKQSVRKIPIKES